MNLHLRSRLALGLTLMAAAGLSACRESATAPDFTEWTTPEVPTLTAAANLLPAIVATAVAAEPKHQVVQLENVFADEQSPAISKVTIWVNDEGMRREESSPDSLYNPGVINVDNLETLSRYNPSTKIFTRNQRGILHIVDQPPYAKNLLEKSRFYKVVEETLNGRKAIRLDGRPEDDPLRNDVLADFSVWLDAETHRVLQTRKLFRPTLGPDFAVTGRVLAYDPPADDSRFVLDPPSDPEVLVLDTVANPVKSEELTPEEARKAVSFPVLDSNDLPAEVKLFGTSVSRSESGKGVDPTVGQLFVRGEDEGYLVVEQFVADPPGSARAKARRDLALKLGKAVKVGDYDGVYVDRLGTRYLVWQTDKTRVKLSANLPEVGEAALLDWARKMTEPKE